VVSDQRERTAQPDIDLSSSASFEDVVDAESRRLFAALRLVAGDRAEAEGLMLDAFMDVWDRWDRVRASGDAPGELFRTAIEMYQRRLGSDGSVRRRKSQPTDGPIAALEASDDMLVALDALEPEERMSVVLMDLFGYPSKDVGELMGISAGDVRAYASHGRAELRRRVGDDDA
jgi:DNA-directed RNA polymerase specialized sigma24 family protein